VFQVREQLADEGEDHAWFNSNRRVSKQSLSGPTRFGAYTGSPS
jgi:hypothetical protein